MRNAKSFLLVKWDLVKQRKQNMVQEAENQRAQKQRLYRWCKLALVREVIKLVWLAYDSRLVVE